MFPDHTIESAPETARPFMRATTNRLGYLPAAVARLATSPQLLEGFLKTSALFENTTLEPVAREVVVMTVAARNGCHVCLAMHTAKLTALDADAELVAALRESRPLADVRLEALRHFTNQVLDNVVDEAPVAAFLAHGYTNRNALEVVLGVGVYTMSTVANRMVDAPVDDALAAYA
jgi:AhpD family alkylhydroperoxidase